MENPILVYRKKMGLTQKQLADLLEIPRITLSCYERKTRKISFQRAIQFEKLTRGVLSRKILRPDIYG